MRIATLSSFIVLAALGCGSSSDGSKNGPSNHSGGSGGSSNGTGGSTSAGPEGQGGLGLPSNGSGGGGAGSDCSDAAKLVYVLSVENDLYSFQPNAKKFTKIGALRCPTSLTPNSMAIDRSATAWVNYVSGDDSQGAIFKVSTKDASCQATSIKLAPGWTRLGMGYSTDAAQSMNEKLFVTGTGNQNTDSPGLGRLDPGATNISPIGQFTGDLAGENAELTGTGDGRLFGFFTTTPVELAEINKTTGAILSNKVLTGVETPSFWAFSFWGGDFYFYTAPSSSGRTTNVTHYSPATGKIDTQYMVNIGFRIVGAGVSTCAPLEQPQ